MAGEVTRRLLPLFVQLVYNSSNRNAVNSKNSIMAKRKKKPISQAEQSRRFLQAAREAGVDERQADKTLERVIRQIRPTQPKGSTKAKGR